MSNNLAENSGDQFIPLFHFPQNQQSKAQLAFQNKIRKIETMSKANQKLESRLQHIKTQLFERLYPLQKEVWENQLITMEILDAKIKDRFFSKRDKIKIKEYILAIGEHLIPVWDDERIMAIIKKHVDTGNKRDHTKGPLTEEEVMEELFEEFYHQFDDDDNDVDDKEHDKGNEPRNWPKMPMQAKRDLEAKGIYRELAKALHPDKEMNDEKKDEKTRIMQKITDAYQNKDLYELLKMRAMHLGQLNISDDDIKLFTQELNSKINELQSQKWMLTKGGPLSGIYQSFYSAKEHLVEKKINEARAEASEMLRCEQSFHKVFQDNNRLKQYLKNL